MGKPPPSRTFSIPGLAFSRLSIIILLSFSATTLLFLSGQLGHIASLISEAFNRPKHPDFSQYIHLVSTVDESQWRRNQGRTIIVGDIHGMYEPLLELMEKVSYDPSVDTLVHVGNIVTKGPLVGSLDVMNFMVSNNVTGVRGNHDQKVLEWRGWIDYIQELRGGRTWLQSLHEDWDKASSQGVTLAEWLKVAKHRSHKSWWSRIPKGWVLFSDHYMIAERLTSAQYQYLVNLPLVLHVPSAHAYIVHAGILPSDPTYKVSHRKQPLARPPTLPKSLKHAELPQLRAIQEAAVLYRVPQNRKPWNLMNMRSVLRDGTISRDNSKGKPWSKFWNDVVSRCDGFRPHKSEDHGALESLPCYPSTVLYGHSASRGLDVKRWSIGLDTGCVHKRRLTALVIGKPVGKDTESGLQQHIAFGDKGHGQLMSVRCR